MDEALWMNRADWGSPTASETAFFDSVAGKTSHHLEKDTKQFMIHVSVSALCDLTLS
jgi:hypothetical protein